MKFFNFVHQLPLDELHKYRFSLNYRVKRKDGVYVKLLQQYLVLECDDMGNPLITMGICSDITAYTPHDKMILTVSKFDDEEGYKIISSDDYLNKPTKISGREIEVLKLIAKGDTDKMIGEELGISFHTAKNHRRSLYKKTDCNNAAQLINYALSCGLI